MTAGVFAAWALVTPPGAHPLRCTTPWRGVECRAVSGRVLAVHRYDEDGDGDLHLLLASRQSVTRPGLSLVKFARRRRPAHVPGFGDWVTVLGVVVEGSHGEDEVAVSFSNITP
jgi:hypothetical protein